MRKIQYVSRYIALSQEGLVPRIECPLDQGSLMVNQTNDEQDFLYCISCNYKRFIGISFYDMLRKELRKAGQDIIEEVF